MSELEPEVPAEAPADPAPLPPGGPGVAVFQGLPDVTMVVNEGNVVGVSGEDGPAHEAGETITVSGPDAIALAAGGHATAVPTGEAVENGTPVEEPPAEEAPAA